MKKVELQSLALSHQMLGEKFQFGELILDYHSTAENNTTIYPTLP